MRTSLWVLSLLAFAAVACSSSSEPGSEDASDVDSSTSLDAEGDTAVDGPVDGPVDAPFDGPVDTFADAFADAKGDAGPDAKGEAGPDVSFDAPDFGETGCFNSSVGTFGECVTLPACAAKGDHVSTAGFCPGPSTIECCTPAPNVADNPPTPAGWKPMVQAAVTPDMTTWAVAILHDPTTYPMFSTTTRTFGTVLVLARVEWHPPDFLNKAIHRGVTLYTK